MSNQKILQFLTEHNRPFTVNDIVKGFEGQWGKSKVQKALQDLVDQEQVLEKTYGKQYVYCIKQSCDGGAKLRDAILQLDRAGNGLETQLRDVEANLRIKSDKLKDFQGVLTLSQAKEKLHTLQEEVENLEFQLQSIEGKTKSLKDKEAISKRYGVVFKEYSKRKRLCMDVIDAILENYPKSKRHLLDDVGIETDEDVKFTIET